MNFANSINNHKIRLTNERWFHITEGHSEIAGYYFEILETIENPSFLSTKINYLKNKKLLWEKKK